MDVSSGGILVLRHASHATIALLLHIHQTKAKVLAIGKFQAAGISSQFLAVKILRANFTIHCYFLQIHYQKYEGLKFVIMKKKNLNPLISLKFSMYFLEPVTVRLYIFKKYFLGFVEVRYDFLS